MTHVLGSTWLEITRTAYPDPDDDTGRYPPDGASCLLGTAAHEPDAASCLGCHPFAEGGP